MTSLGRLNVFKYVAHGKTFERSDEWQRARMRMIFDIKQQDLRHKARLVVGGHLIDSSAFTAYSSTIQDISVRLLMIVAIQNQLNMMVGDISTAFPTAPIAEKVWGIAGPEFGPKEGSTVVLQ